MKIRVSIAVVFCLLVLFITSIASAESKDHAKEMVVMTQQKMALVKNYHVIMALDMAMAAQGKSMKSTINFDMDIFNKPLLAKNKMDILFSVSDNEKLITNLQTHITSLQYIEQSETQILVYTYADGKWHKQSSPIGTFIQNKEYENFLKQVKIASIISESQNTVVIEANMDGKFLRETLQKNVGTLDLAKVNLTDELISSIGDVTYTITIDKNTMTLSSVDMDMSDFMQRFGAKLVEGSAIPDEKKEQLKEMFSNMQMRMHMTMTRYDEIEPFTIPDEAKLAVEDRPAVNPNDQAIVDLTNVINHSNRGKIDLALNDFNKAIEINPQYAFAYAWRGYIFGKMGKGDSAIADYSKAIEIDPYYAYAYHCRGLEYAKKKQFDIAIADYNKAIEVNPKYTQAYFNRGTAYEQKQLYQEAIDNYRTLIVNVPENKATVELAKTRIRALGGVV
jgi:tetratricopeptide (TPR) repeat protein